jgi:hypothetical protein
VDFRRELDKHATPIKIAALIAIAAFAYGLVSMRHYGLTFDSPSLFYAGDRTLYWIEHHDAQRALELDNRTEPEGFVPAFERSPEFADPMHYPVLPGLVCALTSRLFHDDLGWLDLVDGHHLGLLLIHGAGLFLFCIYLVRLLGRLAGATGTAMLATFPSVLGHSFNNAKDWPSALFLTVAILAVGVGVLSRQYRSVLLGGLWLGIGLGAKLQAIFAIPVLFAWAPVAYLLLYWRRERVSAAMVSAYVCIPYFAGLVFFVSWPWLYHGGKVSVWWDHLAEYLHFMVQHGVTPRTWWTSYPLRALLYMSPPIVLVLAALYGGAGWRSLGDQTRRQRIAIWLLLMMSFVYPLWRSARPHANFYGSNRHFMEYIPALCAMAGGGAAIVVMGIERLASRFRLSTHAMETIALACVGGWTACLLAPIAAYRPYEVLYFNMIAGGLGRAQSQALLFMAKTGEREHNASGGEGDYWYTSLREALRPIRIAAKPGMTVGFCGPWPAQVRANNDNASMEIKPGDPKKLINVPLVYVAPQGNIQGCTYTMAREFERQRPILLRVEREGGLIFEVLGQRDGKTHPVRTPPSAYDTLMGT